MTIVWRNCDGLVTEILANRKKSSGVGLGLAIALWIAQMHEGEIHVQSVSGHATTFELWLLVASSIQQKQVYVGGNRNWKRQWC